MLASDSIKYEHGFTFRQGIYVSFEDFRNNRPIPLENIETFKHLRGRPDFLKQVMQKNTVEFVNREGQFQSVKSQNLWGYSNGQSIYCQDARIGIIGSICHFTAFRDLYRYDPGINGSSVNNTYYEQDRAFPYVIDMQTGEVLSFTRKNMEAIFERDPELFDRYKRAKGSRTERMYLFLRQYNERHPLFFPAK